MSTVKTNSPSLYIAALLFILIMGIYFHGMRAQHVDMNESVIVSIRGSEVLRYDPATNSIVPIFSETENYFLDKLSVSPNNDYVGFIKIHKGASPAGYDYNDTASIL